MIIIAFSNKTSKILPRLFCGKLKHCAPIIVDKEKMVMYQFVRRGHIAKINLSMRDIKILGAHGWRFAYVSCALPQDFNLRGLYTCVALCKRAISLRAPYVQTPDALYKKLQNK